MSRYREHLMDNLAVMRQRILAANVYVGRYHVFTIYDPKQRQICAADFDERVLHHALMRVCHPVFDRQLIFDTYATRIGKGTYAALDRAHHAMTRYRYVAKLDVRKYFDSIDHHVLMTLLERLFKDKRLLSIFEQIIDSYHVAPGCGLPIGNLTSQYFANHYLSPLDHFVKEVLRVPCYVRYMDDMLLFGDDKAALLRQVAEVQAFVASRLRLSVKPPVVASSAQGIPFLGYRLQGFRIGLSARSRNRFARKLRLYEKWLRDGVFSQSQYFEHVTPLLAFVSHAYTKAYRRRLLKTVEGRRGRTACCAAAVGTTMRGTVGCPIATTTPPPTATTTTASAWSCSHSLPLLPSFP
ncbi:MAG: RNA-directed DNA polymerase [Bacteroidales bacterium]|nr:RNA-directed DNA polymerase [Bacteroidales bacterium]